MSVCLPLSPILTIAGKRWMLSTYSLNNGGGVWVIFPFVLLAHASLKEMAQEGQQ